MTQNQCNTENEIFFTCVLLTSLTFTWRYLYLWHMSNSCSSMGKVVRGTMHGSRAIVFSVEMTDLHSWTVVSMLRIICILFLMIFWLIPPPMLWGGGGLRRQKLRPSLGDYPFLGPQDCEVELLIPLNNTPADLLKRYILIQMNIIPCMPKLNDCSRIISQFAMSVADLRSRTVRFSGLEHGMYSVWQCCLLCGD